ncbi:MAG: hypothetical protein EP328_04980 [Gammaproteobacteria bacterium]|nr:MAG: hypothetical protein EP328_04980 [Gammaproteobacteria bacterium]
MSISDETLSAFLDAELPEQEMQAVRDALQEDPALTDRIADLAVVDEQLRAHYGEIDEQPLPEAVTAMLAEAPESTGKVVEFPMWRRVRQGVREHTGAAVAAVLVMGFAVAQLGPFTSNDASDQWQTVANALETTPSGENRVLSDGQSLVARFTFSNRDGQYCRQYRLQGRDSASENIACLDQAGEWERVAQIPVEAGSAVGEYQTASGGSALDSTLDRMMASDVMSPEAEKQLIDSGWD